jgi:competence protein ComEA
MRRAPPVSGPLNGLQAGEWRPGRREGTVTHHPHKRSAAIVACLALFLSLAVGAAPAEAAGEKPKSESAGPKEPIDINRATEVQLTELPGIGETMAKRIVEFRDQHGPFQRAEDLMKVKGIGEKSFQKMKPYVKVSTGR